MVNTPMPKSSLLLVLLLLLTAIAPEVFAAQKGDGLIEPGEDEIAELARAAQNPVASMISLPFQSNTDFNFGPLDKTQSVLNVQPVIPFDLNDNWNLITRTIVPFVSMPGLFPARSEKPASVIPFLRPFYRPKYRENGFGVPVPLRCFQPTRTPDWGRMSGGSAHRSWH
jgi:hypothetical protein